METEHTEHLHYSVKDLSEKRKGHLHGKLIDGATVIHQSSHTLETT